MRTTIPKQAVRLLLAGSLAAGLLTTAAVAGAGRASADDLAWPEVCVPQTPVPLANPAQPFNTYSIPWRPGSTSNGTTAAQSPPPGSQIVDPATGQPGTWLDAQPYGDGVELDTWQWPAAGSYVSPFDNAHGTSATNSTTPLLYPPGSTAGTPGTVEPYTSPDLQATVPGSPGNPSVTFATMPLRMNVLLPPGYADHPDTSYPVLYLLGGAGGDFSGYIWPGQGAPGPDTEQDLVAAAKAGHPMIVVVADVPSSGNDTNWYALDSQQAPTADGSPENNPDDAPGFEPAPQWRSFFLKQVVPFIDNQYRTEATASGRFIGGISAGGNAAMSYVGKVDADQHFGRGPYQNLGFGAAGSLSGSLDWLTPALIADFPTVIATAENLSSYWSGSTSGTVPTASATLDGPDSVCAQGSGSTASPIFPPNPSEITHVWQPNDPVFQAKAWPDSQTRMFLTSGEGNPFSLDLAQQTEYYVGTMTENFAAALAGSPTPENVGSRFWTQYNTGFLDSSGGTPTGQTISATGAVNDCPFRPGHNCVNLYTGGTHSSAYWDPGMASFFRWLEPQANTSTP
jgi:S-formylglutathione hydrolase FrmB